MRKLRDFFGNMVGFLDKDSTERREIIQGKVSLAGYHRIKNKLQSIEAKYSVIQINGLDSKKMKVTVDLFTKEVNDAIVQDIKDEIQEKNIRWIS
ncbi:MAG: hypothetical protein OEV93_05260 [Candidatus Moranbacteria bacterium]|nr:hypothetical protein [Candidatus Moranbacteria bacterium]